MGLLVRFLQELACDLRVEFKEQIAITLAGEPLKFDFSEITLTRAKDQNSSLVNS